MGRLTFYGATETVTGSRYILELQGMKLLIDCGLFQGSKKNRLKNWEPFPVPPKEIDRVLLTHAHIDHTGFLPRFCKHGFKGQVHCTHATADLCEILLKDSAHIQQEDARWANKKGFSKHKPALPLYTVKDAENALTHFSPLYYGEDLYLGDNYRLKFKDAGHILGSSFIDIKTTEGKDAKKIFFSGDIGRPAKRILRDPIQAFNVDYLILESTYGNRLHGDSYPIDELARVINESVERGGTLVIPSFAIGRTQSLLYIIRELEEQNKIPDLPIFIDSPMAIDATEIFRKRISDQHLTSRILTLEGKRIFHPKQLHICETRQQSKAINQQKTPAIIISASGMVTGGRILHHLLQRLPDSKNTILFIGFQAYGTRGRTIVEGSQEVKIHGRHIPINAKVESISGFSGHADYNEILAWLMGFNKPPEKTFIVHGEPEAAASMAEKIHTHFGWDVVVPKFGDSFEINL
ncbi:MAG: MBL fold metallo-hydrolase [candidate division Zixibacteria bacterium]|nr:MBL fold metallo-hydrolase [candidate division Zixibacteria bacterium]